MKISTGTGKPAATFSFPPIDINDRLGLALGVTNRGEAYRYYVTTAAQQPAIVGALWFQCYDESTTGRFDGENYQIGFLDICDTPYTGTIAAARSAKK
jgi:hypothetical protein